MPFWRPQPRRPRHQGSINSFFLAFKLPFASPQTLQTLRRPRHQGTINSFFSAFKPAVCQLSCPPNAFLAVPTPQAKAPRPHQQLFLGVQACRLPALKPSKSSAGQGTKAPSLAFSWRSSLPFASPQTLQMPFWQPQPRRSISFWRSNVPLASPQTLQMPFWQPQPRRPRHQGTINSFLGVQACHLPALNQTRQRCPHRRSGRRHPGASPFYSTTPQLQLHYTTAQPQLDYTTLHPAVVGEVTDQVTTATIATTAKTQLQPTFGPSVDLLCHL